MSLVLLSQDLMLTSRMEGVGRKLEMSVKTLRNLESIPENCRLIVIDLTQPGLDIQGIVDEVGKSSNRIPIVACGPHVHEQRLAAASAAGCDLVVSRSQWDREAEKLCEQLLWSQP